MTCNCCSERHKPVYMDGCDQCKARWISRLPARFRDDYLQQRPDLRDRARAEWREDVRQLRGIDKAKRDMDQV